MFKNFTLVSTKHLLLFLIFLIGLNLGSLVGLYFNVLWLFPMGFTSLFCFLIISILINNKRYEHVKIIEEDLEISTNQKFITLKVRRLKYKDKYMADPGIFTVSDFKYFPVAFEAKKLENYLKQFKDDEWVVLNIKF